MRTALRKSALWLSGVVSLGFAGAAEAGFGFTYTVEQGTGALADKNIFKFYAKNDQTGEQAGTKSLLVMEVKFTSLGGPLTFDFRDIDNDGATDANVPGWGISDDAPTATFLRIGPTADNQVVFVSPLWHRSDSNNDGTPDKDPVPLYQSRNDVQLTTFNPNRLDATQGAGLLYGVAVVPLGSDVKVEGKVAAERGGIIETGAEMSLAEAVAAAMALDPPPGGLGDGPVGGAPLEPGPNFNFSFVAQAPEPSGLVLLGLGALAMCGRRRK